MKKTTYRTSPGYAKRKRKRAHMIGRSAYKARKKANSPDNFSIGSHDG